MKTLLRTGLVIYFCASQAFADTPVDSYKAADEAFKAATSSIDNAIGDQVKQQRYLDSQTKIADARSKIYKALSDANSVGAKQKSTGLTRQT